MPRFSRMVPGSAPALGCRRVRLAPDLSKQPPACGRIFFNSAREGACWCTRGRVRSPGPRRCRAIFCGAAASIPVAELGTSFDGAWHGLASCSRNFKCRAFRVGRAHSISRRARMSEPSKAQNRAVKILRCFWKSKSRQEYGGLLANRFAVGVRAFAPGADHHARAGI